MSKSKKKGGKEKHLDPDRLYEKPQEFLNKVSIKIDA